MRFHFPYFLLLSTLALACSGKVNDTPADAGDTADSPVDDAPLPYDTSDVPETPVHVTKIQKLDLLFVVDNSFSMADKQSELARAVPQLIASLTGGVPSLKVVQDLHVGVITSSLGSHGTSACSSMFGPHEDDHGHLLPRPSEGSGSGFQISGGSVVSATCPAPVAASPLFWAYGSEPGAATTQLQTSCVVESAKEDGCGYESTLEAAYHFLVDPKPYLTADVTCTFGAGGDACGNNKIVVSGVDDEVLKERAAFLRPDSALAVVVLTDENDASLKTAGLNWIPWGYGKAQMKRGWASCAHVPDDFEPESAADFDKLHSMYGCHSCFEDSSDPNCVAPWPTSTPLNADVDGRNLRAFHQVQRYGYNFLWGLQRYVDAFTATQVVASDGTLGVNPIFQGGVRTRDLVLFAPIVGVPKTLVAGADGLPKNLTEADWDKIISPDLAKRDPHMIESIAPRTGIAKFAGDRSVDAVNGGDRDIADGDDLQYACIAKRAVTTAALDCSTPNADKVNPLCDPGAQPYFKAYPGLRHLRVAHALGAQSVVSSICDSSLTGAMQGIVARLQPMIAE